MRHDTKGARMSANVDNLKEFLNSLNDIKSEDFTKMAEENLSDDAIDEMAAYLEDFYQIDDEEELGLLVQIMIIGYLAAKKN